MKVTLLNYTPHPEETIAAAAKLCYSDKSIDEIMLKLSESDSKEFIDKLMGLGHESPIEHVTFTFGIEGISRSNSHQLVRHRIASYSQKSKRYVSETNFGYVIPPSIEKNPTIKDRYEKLMTYIQNEYNSIRNDLVNYHIDNDGMDRRTAEKKANEDARYVLPNACETSLIVTMNVRSLFNFFKLRCCNRAQWEIRAMADEMYRLCYTVAPNIFRYAGPGCIQNNLKCPEGSMCCGKPIEKLKHFKALRGETTI